MKRTLAILLSVFLLILCGCSEQMATPEGSSFSASSSNGNVSATSPEEPPSHITADLGNNITVDAQIIMPTEETRLGNWQIEPFVFDRELTCTVLLGEGWKINDTIPAVSGIEYFIGGEKQLLLYDGGRTGIGLSAGESDSIASIYGIAPTEPAEPNFMTAKEAVKLVQDTLSALGLETQVLQCIPLTQEAIHALAQAYQTIYGGDPAEYENCPPCYVIDLCQIVDNVPICNADIQLSPGDANTPPNFISQPSIQAVVTAEGLYELIATNCILKGAQTASGLNILPAEEILKLLQKDYEDIINTSPIMIRSMALEYAVLPLSSSDKTLQLRPVWVVAGTEEAQPESARRREKDAGSAKPLILFFDAVTGQQVEDSFR